MAVAYICWQVLSSLQICSGCVLSVSQVLWQPVLFTLLGGRLMSELLVVHEMHTSAPQATRRNQATGCLPFPERHVRGWHSGQRTAAHY